MSPPGAQTNNITNATLGIMSMNNGTAEAKHYTCVRFYVSTVSFSFLLLFNLIVNWTIVREERLRGHARFVLLFHLLGSALVHLGTSSGFYYQMDRGARPGPTACQLIVTVMITSASNILLTLTAMALDRYVAVCYPLRYSALCSGRRWPWLIGLLTWALALVIPLSLLSTARGAGSGPEGQCGREQLKKGSVQKILLISTCTLVILYSYVRILVEGRRLGVLNRRNRVGWNTIILHGTQLAVYILPNFVNYVLTVLQRRGLLQEGTKELSAVVSFAFFSLAQCVAPVIYGLRKDELVEQLQQRFPRCARHLKTVLLAGWAVHAVPRTRTLPIPRERTLTVLTIVPVEEPCAETRPLAVTSSVQDLSISNSNSLVLYERG